MSRKSLRLLLPEISFQVRDSAIYYVYYFTLNLVASNDLKDLNEAIEKGLYALHAIAKLEKEKEKAQQGISTEKKGWFYQYLSAFDSISRKGRYFGRVCITSPICCCE